MRWAARRRCPVVLIREVGPDDALAVHLARTTELEEEYLTRYPEREIDPSRLTITSRS